jgi:ATP-dependent DNA ligase
MDLEGLVLKRRDRPYRGSRSKLWAKVKNGSGGGSVPVMRTREDCLAYRDENQRIK